jgi:hypothetical protein
MGAEMTNAVKTSNGTNGKAPIIKLALWTGSLGLGALLLNRLLRGRRERIDVGAVSDSWLAERRGVSDELPY